jgi:methylmalonyl-CoA/ethylmalonyl-CoA epimerase
MQRIEHLGIAVKSLEEAIPVYEKLLNSPCYKIEEVESEGVRTAFFRIGESKIELLEAKNPNSPIAKFIEKRGMGMHHVAFGVQDIHAEIERLQEQGYELINPTPKEGADSKLIAFLHPKGTTGVLIELCADR